MSENQKQISKETLNVDNGELLSLVVCMGSSLEANPEEVLERPLKDWPTWFQAEGLDVQSLISFIDDVAKDSDLSSAGVKQLFAQQTQEGATTGGFLGELRQREPLVAQAIDSRLKELAEEAAGLEHVAGGTSKLHGHWGINTGIALGCIAVLGITFAAYDSSNDWKYSKAMSSALKKQWNEFFGSRRAEGEHPLERAAEEQIQYMENHQEINPLAPRAEEALSNEASNNREIGTIHRDLLIKPEQTLEVVREDYTNRAAILPEAEKSAEQIITSQISDALGSKIVQEGLVNEVDNLQENNQRLIADELKALEYERQAIKAEFVLNQQAIEKRLGLTSYGIENLKTSYGLYKADGGFARWDSLKILRSEWDQIKNDTLLQDMAKMDYKFFERNEVINNDIIKLAKNAAYGKKYINEVIDNPELEVIFDKEAMAYIDNSILDNTKIYDDIEHELITGVERAELEAIENAFSGEESRIISAEDNFIEDTIDGLIP